MSFRERVGETAHPGIRRVGQEFPEIDRRMKIDLLTKKQFGDTLELPDS
jgi:hypothetical protein